MSRHAAPRREAPAMIATVVAGLAVIVTGDWHPRRGPYPS